MRVLIVCGGTGGHIFPGLALARTLEQQGDKILFLGCKTKMEMGIIPKYGYSIIGMPISGLNRRNIFANISLPYKILKSIRQAQKVINSFHPNFIIGTGGYVQLPVVIAGYLKGIPIYLQEQNVVPGLCNTICKKFSEKIFTAFEGMEKYFGRKNCLLGNPLFYLPVSNEQLKIKAYKYFQLSEKKPIVLILGGSLGTSMLINFVNNNPEKFVKSDLQVILSVGKQNKVSKYQTTINRIKIFQYIDRMDYAYAIADIVVSRAGALTLSELSANKKVSIIIPSPNVTNNHQYKNAKNLADKGAVVLVEEKDIDKILFKNIIDLVNDEDKRNSLKENISKFCRINASEKIIDNIKNEILKNSSL